MRVLAIESSCDETAIAILEGSGHSLKLVKNLVYSQVDIHKKYGGVVPELAARQHTETIIPLLDKSLGRNKLQSIDYIAVTSGPGLISSLILGISVAKTLSFSSGKPLVSVNHIEGHIYSNWLSNKELVQSSYKYLPALLLIVSGGHTELILMTGHGNYQLLGQTLDDAVGEAYDKVAKLLNLGYPGGPIVSQRAELGNIKAYDFPRPMIDRSNYDFSLAGLKTAVLYALEKKKNIKPNDINDVCASFQEAVVDVLVGKTLKASREYSVKSIMVAGGVSANKRLKQRLSQVALEKKLPFFYPDLKYTGDNAAMIAVAAYYNIISKNTRLYKGIKVLHIKAQANWHLVNKS